MPFADIAEASQAACKSHDDNANRPYKHVAELRRIQAVCQDTIHSGRAKPAEIASLTRAYVEAGKLILVHQGKAANISQALRPETTKSKRQAPAALPLEYGEPSKPLE